MPLRWRPDATYVPDVPNVRRIMPYIMRSKVESVVYFDQKVRFEPMRAFLADLSARTGLKATPTHLMVWALVQTIHRRPRLNRFTAGGRIWQRRGIWVSFSGKKAKSDDHPIITVKRRIEPAWTLEEVIRDLDGAIREGRGDADTHTDKELKLFFRLPSLALMAAAWLLLWLDHFGLLPWAFMKDDPMFASVFLANLGTIDMDPAYHHLFEYGNIPTFVMAGRARNELCVEEDGTTEVRKVIPFRYTFDERVEDGLYCAQSLGMFKEILEDPAAAIARHREEHGR